MSCLGTSLDAEVAASTGFEAFEALSDFFADPVGAIVAGTAAAEISINAASWL